MKVEVYKNQLEYIEFKIKEARILGIEFDLKRAKKGWNNVRQNYKTLTVESKYLRQVSSLLHKTESYFTEEEMITGYVAPKYSELSETEKEIWHEKENQNQE